MSFGSFGSNTFGGAQKPAFGFGASGTTSPSTFGFNKPAQSTAFGGGNMFGAAPAGNAFGAPAANAFGTAPAFGAPAANTFGAPASGAFGANASGFGKPAFSTASTLPTSGFGTPFGGSGATATGGFGLNRPAGTTSPSTAFGGGGSLGNAFGGATSTGFGGSAFGTNPASTNAFGGNTTGGFGTSASAAPAFGSTTGGAFGGGGFGMTAGTQQQSTGAFGGFGQQTTAPAFGGATNAFGGGGGFGAQQQGGTGNPKFTPFNISETSKTGPSNLSLQVITAMPQYANKSLEELRFEDYQRGNKGGTTTGGFLGGMTSPFKQNTFGTTSPSTNVFGSTGSAPSAFGATSTAFGQQPAATGGFGTASNTGFGFGQQTTTSAFGQQAAPAFGQPTANAFGQSTQPFGQTSSAFGQPQSSGFGQSAGAFGQPAAGAFGQTAGSTFGQQPSTTGGFGQTTSTGFGQTAAPSAFGQSTTPAFGASAFGQPSTGFGQTAPAFGQPTPSTGFGQTTSAFGQQSGTTGFGQTGSTFGQATTAPAFGQPATSTFGQPATTGFGQTTAPAFGATTGTSGFGGFGSTAPTGGAFGQPAQSTGFGGFGSTTPAATTGFGSTTTGGFGQATTLGGFGTTATTTTPTTGTTSGFGGFGSQPSTTTLGGGFGSGGFGKSSFSLPTTSTATTSTLGGGFGGGFGTTGTTGFGAPMSNTGFGSTFGQPAQTQFGIMNTQQQQQQQQQFMSQMGQPQSLSSKIDLLRRKKDELTFGVQAGDLTQAQALADQRPIPNLFTGFSGGKTVQRTTPQLLSVGGVGRVNTTRVVPRGMKSTLSPAVTPSGTPSESASNTPRLLLLSSPVPTPSRFSLSTAVTPYNGQMSVQATPDTGFSTRGRDAKRLVLQPAVYGGSLPDPTEDLPPPQHFRNQNSSINAAGYPNRISGDKVVVTPAKNAPSVSSIVLSEGQSHSSDRSVKMGDATGLTPSGATATPLAVSTGRRTDVLSTPNVDDDTVPRHISFKPSPSPKVTTQQVERAAPPSLTKTGYFTSPDMSVLNRMSDQELSRVKNFAVYRPNVGQIVWDGEIDVRGLDLDAVVRIDRKEVFVYEGVDDPVPPLGLGLNRPATVTLSNVFPKEGSSESKVRAFGKKLEDFCALNDATFISYSLESGDWVFAVKHFSRYGLDDDSDDEDDEPVDEHKGENSTKEKDYGDYRLHSPMSGGAILTPSDTIQRLRRILMNDSVDPQDQAQYEPQELLNTPAGRPVSFNLTVLGHNQQDQSSAKSSSGQKRGRQRSIAATAWMNDDSSREEAQLRQNEIRTNNEKRRKALFTDGAQSMEELKARLRASRPATAFHSVRESYALNEIRGVKSNYAKMSGLSSERADVQSYTKPTLSSSGQKRGITDFGLAMGRSFRVGWSKDGRIVHAGNLIFNNNNASHGTIHSVAVEAVDPHCWTARRLSESGTNSVVSMEQPLSALLASSHKEGNESFQTQGANNAIQEIPLWKAPLADPAELHEYIPFLKFLRQTINSYQEHNLLTPEHPDWHACKAIELVNAAYGQEKASISSDLVQRSCDIMPLFEDRPDTVAPEMWERRRTVLSRWLQAAAAPNVVSNSDVDDGHAGQCGATYQRIFELLSCHRVDDAIAVAENAGMFRLATLLSQIDGDSSLPTLIRNQLEIWRCSDAALTIPDELLLIYRLLGAEAIVEDNDSALGPRSILKGLGWVRAVGILFWFCAKNDSLIDNVGRLTASLEAYRIALGDDLVDAPLTSYVDDKSPFGGDVDYPYAKHGLYQLLELLFPSNNDSNSGLEGAMNDEEEEERMLAADTARRVIACLSPSGFTRDQMDYRTSYILLVLLESAGIADENAAYALIIRQHMIFQLLSSGQWQWALFVAMQIRDNTTRYTLSKDIVLRWGGSLNWEDNNNSLSAVPNTNQFVSRALNIPERWIHEATAYRCGYSFNFASQVTYLNFAHMWSAARQILCVHIAPHAILASDTASDGLLALLESIEQQEKDEKLQLRMHTYVDTWTDLSDMFLSFLRLRDFVQSLSEEDLRQLGLQNKENVSPMRMESVLNEKLTEALNESKQLLSRLSAFQKQQNDMKKQNQACNIFQSEEKVGTVLIYDMCTFLYRLVTKLVHLTASNHEELGAERLQLISGEYFRADGLNVGDSITSPIHDDALLSAYHQFSHGFFEDAAKRVMTVV